MSTFHLSSFCQFDYLGIPVSPWFCLLQQHASLFCWRTW